MRIGLRVQSSKYSISPKQKPLETNHQMASTDEHARASMPEKAASDHVEDTRNVDNDYEYTPAEQRKIIHKVDRRLLPVLGLMQAVSFLDRANMSNASVAGYDMTS